MRAQQIALYYRVVYPRLGWLYSSHMQPSLQNETIDDFFCYTVSDVRGNSEQHAFLTGGGCHGRYVGFSGCIRVFATFTMT